MLKFQCLTRHSLLFNKRVTSVDSMKQWLFQCLTRHSLLFNKIASPTATSSRRSTFQCLTRHSLLFNSPTPARHRPAAPEFQCLTRHSLLFNSDEASVEASVLAQFQCLTRHSLLFNHSSWATSCVATPVSMPHSAFLALQPGAGGVWVK